MITGRRHVSVTSAAWKLRLEFEGEFEKSSLCSQKN